MSSGNHELFEVGLRNRREVVGEKYVNNALKNGSDEFGYPSQQLVTEWCWGNVWSRPGVNRKQRSLLSEYIPHNLHSSHADCIKLAVGDKNWRTVPELIPLDIGMLVALKSWPEVGIHIRGAINNGLTELEIRESLLQATIYCGVPAGVEAFKTANKVLDEMAAAGEYRRQLSNLSPDAS